MVNDLDAMLGNDFDVREMARSADVPLRATRNGYELDMPDEDIAEEMPPMDVEPTAQPEQESADPFEVLSRVGTTVYDLPNMAIRSILRAGGEAVYSAGGIDEDQVKTWRKMLDLSGKMAEDEGVFPTARGLVEGVAQFGAGMFPPFKAMRAMGVSRPAAALISEGLSGAFGFNPDDPNVGNFINSFEGRPEWLKAIGDFIETDPNDTEAENRFRNMLQDVVPSAFIEGLVKVVSKVRNMDADTLIEAGEEAEQRLDSMMSGTTLSANPVSAAGDAMIAGAGRMAGARRSAETDKMVADDLVNRPQLWGEDAPDINERREMVDAMLRGERFENDESVAQLFNDHAERLRIEQAEPAPVFYSAVANAVDGLPMDKGNASQMRAMIAKSAEVKPEEMAWIGLDDFLKGKKSVTKQEIKEFVDANQVQIEEVIKGTAPDKGETSRAFQLQNQTGTDLVRAAVRSGYPELEAIGLPIQIQQGAILARELPEELQPFAFRHFSAYDEYAEMKFAGRETTTKFSDYTLPGGENYREVLLRLPERSGPVDGRTPNQTAKDLFGDDVGSIYDLSPEQQSILQRELDKQYKQGEKRLADNFTGGHYDEPNVLAHIRLNDRTGPDGEKILFVEEIQSDWHQKGRKQGYKSAKGLTAKRAEDPNFYLVSRNGEFIDSVNATSEAEAINVVSQGGVPDAPLKKTWHEMSFRRIARMAAEEGYDAIAFTPGKLQAERYDLSKQVKQIIVERRTDDTIKLKAYDLNDNATIEKVLTDEAQLEEFIGKEPAAKAIEQMNASKAAGSLIHRADIRDVDLQVGGEGMKGFYDKMLKGYASKWGKKFGAKVGVIDLETGKGMKIRRRGVDSPLEQKTTTEQVWTLPVTKKMRDSVLRKGVATFGAAGVAAGVNNEARPNGD